MLLAARRATRETPRPHGMPSYRATYKNFRDWSKLHWKCIDHVKIVWKIYGYHVIKTYWWVSERLQHLSSSVLVEILQSCTKPSICMCWCVMVLIFQNFIRNYYAPETMFLVVWLLITWESDISNPSVKSSPPGATYMHWWTGSALVQLMACHLFGAKPLPDPILTYCQLDLRNKLQWNFNQNTNLFIHENASETIVYEMAAILSRWEIELNHQQTVT